MTTLSSTSTLQLSDGNAIPMLGLGVYQMDEAECLNAITHALEIGLRHIDTAKGYRNEEAVGAALKKASVPREEVFITSKIMPFTPDPKTTRAEVEDSLQKLGTEVIDLYLIHWPVREGTEEMWETLCTLRDEGKIRSTGVSNFTTRRLEKQFLPLVSGSPVVNQFECHVFLAREERVKVQREKGIVPVAHTPLAQAKYLDDSVLMRIAQHHGKTTAQVMLRWLLQREIVVIPKSSNPKRIEENTDLFDFELQPEEMREIAALDRSEELVTWRPEDDWF